ncbi:Uncharacterized protein SCG7086_AD_00330 [Chlamydiales bacterium SCGC AG-110-P3]|nr:Uncharacterized protein SCG7086_AD_00330 [Chlamydiales bacterium SCGC AG-110-P3]
MPLQPFKQLYIKTLTITILVICSCYANPAIGSETKQEKNAIDYYSHLAKVPNGAFFDPPEGWGFADPSLMNENLKMLVVGKGSNVLPPTINLSQEVFDGTMKEYIEIAKRITRDRGGSWRRMGTVKTAAGKATLAQTETRTEFGETKMFHAFLLHRGIIHIVTASAIKNEYSAFYDTFFKAIQSLRVNQSPEEMLSDSARRATLDDACATVKTQWKAVTQGLETKKRRSETEREQIVAVFDSNDFQNGAWRAFTERVNSEFEEMGEEWQEAVLQIVRSELIRA